MGLCFPYVVHSVFVSVVNDISSFIQATPSAPKAARLIIAETTPIGWGCAARFGFRGWVAARGDPVPR